ncbi:hypothetical protein CYMTET_49215 [Cymbomonas tetramitiformis]|uniref:Uncharacterized protein n=1 Tax=Cymbomonas tetramitiformis TaxID=36881 RepID=A0AAE0BQN2_9CHLO|nr:hypothetical protein CYMTET_49215 [Cymbomonas tetramitiformis]
MEGAILQNMIIPAIVPCAAAACKLAAWTAASALLYAWRRSKVHKLTMSDVLTRHFEVGILSAVSLLEFPTDNPKVAALSRGRAALFYYYYPKANGAGVCTLSFELCIGHVPRE